MISMGHSKNQLPKNQKSSENICSSSMILSTNMFVIYINIYIDERKNREINDNTILTS